MKILTPFTDFNYQQEEKSSNEVEKPAEIKPEVEEQKTDEKHDDTKTLDKKPKKKKEPPKPIPGKQKNTVYNQCIK